MVLKSAAKLGIIAGGGDAPGLLIAACRAQGRPFHVLALTGYADAAVIGDAPADWIRMGQAGTGFDILKRVGVEQVVMIGPVDRPTLSDLAPDLRTAGFFARIGLKALGDDGLLRAVVAELESEGLSVVGIDDILSDCLMPAGVLGRIYPDEVASADIAHGRMVANTLGRLDIGQSVVVQQGIVLGVEAVEGTERLLARVGPLARGGPGGVLVKCKKPNQDRRVDLPTIGIETVRQIHQAGLRGLAVDAGSTLALGLDPLVAEADRLGLFVAGLDDTSTVPAVPVFYLVAGEPSGDILGAALMAALRAKLKGRVRFCGIGGQAMTAQGLSSLFPMAELSVMGLAEVVPSIPNVLRRLAQTIKDIAKTRPVAVVTIDSWGFCGRVQTRVQAELPGIKRLHYVAPMVWAWKAKRTKQLARVLDHLMTLLPFEPELFEREGLPTTFVGHPVIETTMAEDAGARFRAAHSIPADAPILAVLPGSRRTETGRLLPIFREVAEVLARKYPGLYFVTPTVDGVAAQVRTATALWGVPVLVVEGLAEKQAAFAAATVALAASGSVTLELAKACVPMIVSYKVSSLTAFIAFKILRLKGQYASLLNILAHKAIIPEYIQHNCRADALTEAVDRLLADPDLRRAQVRDLTQALGFLGLGDARPSERAADVVLKAVGLSETEVGEKGV